MISFLHSLSDVRRGTVPTHPTNPCPLESTSPRACKGELKARSQFGEEDEAGTIRVNGAPFIEKIAGSLQAVYDDHWLSEYSDVDDVT